MNDDESKPTLAAGMAMRSIWMAVAAGVLGAACRFDALGITTQALLALLSLALCLIAIVFAVVALIRITHADSSAVLLPALVGLSLGIYDNVMLFRWNRDGWAKARHESQQAHNNPASRPTQVAVTRSPQPVSKIKYELPAFNAIPDLVPKIRAEAARQQGEDAAVLRAWASHLERFHALYADTLASSNKLHAANLLDPRMITSFKDDEGMRRRKLANEYADAWQKLDDALFTFSGSFYKDLDQEQVSPGRTGVEARAIMAFVQQPDVAARIDVLHKFCKAEEAVGRGYNYSANAVFSYAQLLSRMPNPRPELRKDMDDQLWKLKQAEQAAATARQEVFADSGGAK